MADYYKILGVSKNASIDEVKRAYRDSVRKYHPDNYYGKPEYQEMNDKFKEINEAYQVLSDPEKKQMYDQYGDAFEQARQRGGAGGFDGFRDWAAYAEAMKQNGGRGFSSDGFDFGDLGDLGDIFSSFFGGSTKTRRGSARPGRDLHYQMEISFQEAVFGSEKEIVLDKFNLCQECGGNGVAKDSAYQTCSFCHGRGQITRVQSTFLGNFRTSSVCHKCNGQGKIPEKECLNCRGEGRIRQKKNLKIKIPPGIDNGQTINFQGQGEAGRGGVGNLYITFKVFPDSDFKRQDYDVLTEKEISISQAILGDKILIKTLDGQINLKIPAGTKSGQVFKLKNRGVQHLRGRGRGDHLITIFIKIPKNLNKKQKELIEKIKKEGL